MRWRSAWLARKELRELVTSRAFLVFALLLGPLVGRALMLAIAAYSESSSIAGGSAALAQGLSPLDGIVVPTFGAYAIALALLFPFAAIRLVTAEKESGALALMLQSRHSLTKQVVVKFVVLLGAWVVSWIPGLVGLALWRGHGGHLYAPEVFSVLLAHLLRGALVISVAMIAAAVTEHASAAAMLTLAFTLGAVALDFVAEIQGGLLRQLADVSPEGTLRAFEDGEVRLDAIGVIAVTVASHLALAVVWLHPGRDRGTRWAATGAIFIFSTGLTVAAAEARRGWDFSEDRRSSFGFADEQALRRIRQPVRVEVNLAPDDPQLADLDRAVLHKLRRTLPNVTVVNISGSESASARAESREPRAKSRELYGEVWYQVGSKRAMSRSANEAIVLQLIYDVAGVAHPPRSIRAYPGYPIVVVPTAAPYLFYLLFPALVAGAWWWMRQPPRQPHFVP